jgi:pimeloyl-ACP methyl ester carboxylesterase
MHERLVEGTFDPDLLDAQITQRLYQLALERADSPAAARAIKGSVRSLLLHMSTPSGLLTDLLRIDKPVLVIHGARDRWVPAWPARFALTVRTGWDGSILEDCGHIPPLEKADEVTAQISDWYAERMARKER